MDMMEKLQGIKDFVEDKVDDLDIKEKLEGLKDKVDDLDIKEKLEGIKDKAEELGIKEKLEEVKGKVEDTIKDKAAAIKDMLDGNKDGK